MQRGLAEYWHPGYNRFADEVFPTGYVGEGPVLPLDCYEEFFKALNKAQLEAHALVVGGFSLEMNRRKYNPKLPEKLSKDLDFKLKEASKILGFIEKYAKRKFEYPIFENGMEIRNIPIRYYDTVPDLKWIFAVREYDEGKPVKRMGVEILNRQEFLDHEPNGVLQGLRISGYPFGKLGPKRWFQDPASTAIIRARIASTERHPCKSIPQLELALQLVPDMLEDQTAAYKAGEQPRDPSIIAHRLLAKLTSPN